MTNSTPDESAAIIAAGIRALGDLLEAQKETVRTIDEQEARLEELEGKIVSLLERVNDPEQLDRVPVLRIATTNT